MKVPNLHGIAWFSPPDAGGENVSSIQYRYLSALYGWKIDFENPSVIYAGSESQIELAVQFKQNFPDLPLIMNFWGWMPERFLNEEWSKHYHNRLDIIKKNVDVITVPSRLVLEQLETFGVNNKIVILPPGIDTITAFAKLGDIYRWVISENMIISVGRLVEHKKFDEVINALEGLPAWYCIIGDGPEKQKLIDLAKARRVNLNILDKADDLEKYGMLALATLLIVPSKYEGFCMPIAEAASVRVPSLVRDLATHKLVYQDAVDYFSDEMSLRKKIALYLFDITYRNSFVNKAARIAIDFSAITRSTHLDTLLKENSTTHLKATAKEWYERREISLADLYDIDALMDQTYYSYRTNPDEDLFKFRIEPLIKNTTGKLVLDLGSSTGVFGIHLAKAGFDVESIDISPEYLKIATKNAERYGVSEKIKFSQMDARQLRFTSDYFDSVWAGEIIEHFEDSTEMINEILRVLKVKGRLLFTVPYGDACYDPLHKQIFNTEGDIKKIFAGFNNFNLKEIFRVGSRAGQHNNWFAWGEKL